MNFELIYLLPLAFVCEFVDSTLGMGYGTTLTPLLLIIGFDPVLVVPAVLISEFMASGLAALLHHKAKNVNFSRGSKDLKVALVLSIFAVLGAIASAYIAVNIPKEILKLVISSIVISMAIIIVITLKYKPKFSWSKIITLGTVASLNKGMSGGGYGPLVMGGQMLSGIGVKNAIGITSFSESVTCLVGAIFWFILSKGIDVNLVVWLSVGAILSVPLSAITVKIMPEKKIKIIAAIVILGLGLFSLGKVILSL